ncbi:MAG: hypothetical protein H0V66_09190 [Bdellovibrionales bacterium]|nr:hypothetical protein [Bdellovibrionales bacterium]
MLPPFWPNQHYKKLGTALLGLCFSFFVNSQTTATIPTPASVEYPGIIESLEKLIQIDNTKYSKKNDLLLKNGRTLNDVATVTALEVDPDYLNSIILHSDPGYVKLASSNKCQFYNAIINDLLRNSEGRLANVFVTYVNKNQERDSAILLKKDFINKVVSLECPETPKLIEQFQVKNLDQTLKTVSFEPPTGKDQCHNTYLEWLNNTQTPYFCKLHEFMKEARNKSGDPKDLVQRQAISAILEKKMSLHQRDYLENLCENLDHEDLFCEDFLTVSFWSKVANGSESKIYAEDICRKVMGSATLNDAQMKQCISKIRKENDHCLYPGGRNQGLIPAPQCDTLATALNYSSLRADYKDCPASSDQQAVTNMSRILLNISKEKIAPFDGPCSVISSGVTFAFNQKFDNDENWKLEACFDDAMTEKEVCYKTFFGSYSTLPESYNMVVANILRRTRGADQSLKCSMLDSEDYNPLLLQYKSGCYIIYERNKCFISQCKHRIIYNDRSIDFVKIKNRVTLDYFASNVVDERFSQHYLLTHDYRQNGRIMNNVGSIVSFFKKSKKGVIHGVGCAEELLPSFFKTRAFNQCTPLPFIIDGMIRENDKTVFVTRSAVDTLQAPRLVSWSLVYSAIKSYQRAHPLRLWTLYGLD